MPVSINTSGDIIVTDTSSSLFSQMCDGAIAVPKLTDQQLSRSEKKKARSRVAYVNPWAPAAVDLTPAIPAKPKKQRHLAAWYALRRSKIAAIRSRTRTFRSTSLSFFN